MTLFATIIFIIYTLFIALAAVGFIFYKNAISATSTAINGFSIIIPARNEAENIHACLQSIIRNRPNCPYEILVIDDYSEDQTAIIVEQFFTEYPIGKLIRLSEYLEAENAINSYKKKAIEIAISESQYEWIVQTDADCIVPETWLNSIESKATNPHIHFIAAPVDFLPLKGGLEKRLLYWFQSIDFLTMQGITVATHYFQIGQMCNGANLAYRKSSFYTIDGFKNIDGIASGDDMLLLHKFTAVFPEGIAFLKTKEAIVKTLAQPSFTSFLNQRIRWSSKADSYKDKRLTYMLAVVYLFNLSVLIIFILGIYNINYLHLALYLLVGKIIVEYLLVIPASVFYKKENQLLVFPILQPLHILYIISAGFLGKFGKYQWKNRTVK